MLAAHVLTACARGVSFTSQSLQALCCSVCALLCIHLTDQLAYLVELLNGTIERGVPVLLVHVVVACP